MNAPRALTSAGSLCGALEGGIAVFRGIPYARAPVGALRFAPPESALPWSGVRDATRFAASQPQARDAFIERLGLAADTPASEDCLHLNVWAPRAAGADAGLPVLVWIHGGAFIGGSACSALYDGTRIAARGAVVVTLNYRVGALGFLYADGVPANLGLRDQIAALSWVEREIANFGGDPRNVTVFGESAGAGSICALLAMPEARGALRRAIVQSAAPDGMIDPDEARRRGELVLARLGVIPGDLAGLRALRVEDIVRAQSECAARDGPFEHAMLFLPVIDGESLPQRPIEAVRAGHAREIELIIGTTADELRLYAASPAMRALDARTLERHAERVLAGGRGRNALETYARERSARGASTAPDALFMALESDRNLRVPAIRLAEAQREWQPRTYMYLFDWTSPLDGGVLGSCHALDLSFTFGTLDLERVSAFAGSGPQARRLSDAMIDAWAGFARCGDPSHPGIGAWPAYDGSARATLRLGSRCEVVRAPGDAERRIWDPEPV